MLSGVAQVRGRGSEDGVLPAAAGHRGLDGRMHLAGPMQAVHGEYVVSTGDGGYRTEEMQRGSVTAVNDRRFCTRLKPWPSSEYQMYVTGIARCRIASTI